MSDFRDWLKEQINIPALDWEGKYGELKAQFIEMGQLKSDFDIEKFTVMSKGRFPAHQFHMLMRQYSLALYEMRRLALDREEHLRKIKYAKKGMEMDGYPDIEIARHQNEIDMIELQMVNKISSLEHFERVRQKLLADHGEFTNEQYQAEEPEFWKWNMLRLALEEASERMTGIKAGTWQTIQQLEEPAPLTPEYQIAVRDEHGKIDFDRAKELTNPTKKLIE